MKNILSAKLDCVREYKSLMLNSKGLIVEAVPGERFWSCGLSKADVYQQRSWSGDNMMGKLHMELRAEIQLIQSIIMAQQNHMSQQCKSYSNIDDIYFNLEHAQVTIFTKSAKCAYAFADDFAVPRKAVRVVTGSNYLGS